MRIGHVTTLYPAYIQQLMISAALNHLDQNYSSLLDQLNNDFYSWSTFYKSELASLGFNMESYFLNFRKLQYCWAQENGAEHDDSSLQGICIEQLKRLAPEILFYDHSDWSLLSRIRASVPSIRFVLGWQGSFLPHTPYSRDVDLMLSCAPETVAIIKSLGGNAHHLNHAFEPSICAHIAASNKRYQVVFVGQVLRGMGLHDLREDLLTSLLESLPVTIFAPPPSTSAWNELLKLSLRWPLAALMRTITPSKLREYVRHQFPLLHALLTPPPIFRLNHNHRLAKKFQPPVFGRAMYSTLAQSDVVLNCHASSSPHFASNMRLFESTGVGSCLVTDYKTNISDLFEPDKEVVVYKSIGEAKDKIRWLMANPDARASIAKAGQLRCHREHTYKIRAKQLADIIRANI